MIRLFNVFNSGVKDLAMKEEDEDVAGSKDSAVSKDEEEGEEEEEGE
jgi:hypothetical protein